MSSEAQRNGNPRTRQLIVDALSRLLERKPLEDISVADVLVEAGLSSRTTFYKHFASRDEAFIALVEDSLGQIRRVVDAVINDPKVRRSPETRQAVTLWMQRGARHRGLLFSLVSEWPRIPGVRQMFLGFMADLVARAAAAIEADRRAGLVVSRLSSERLAAMVLWSAERSVYAALIGAEGFTDGHAVADVLVATHLGVIYGVDLPAAARDASRAPWLTI